VTLSWDQNASFRPDTYNIIKLTNGQAAGIAQSKDPIYTDSGYDTNVPTCYTISYKDLCDNASPASQPACPIQLTGTVQGDNTIVLTWSPYTGWVGGVSQYQILKFDEEGNSLGSIMTGSTGYTDATVDFDHQVYRYTIEAIPNAGGITPSVSNTKTETKNPNLVYPSAFTPNGDGLNDRFIVFGRYVSGFEMSIFNRWGELLFSTGDLADGWDGTFNGSRMPEGTYAFRAKIRDLTGKMHDRSGSILLLRKKE
jgi:gliding motility-associated-like protein